MPVAVLQLEGRLIVSGGVGGRPAAWYSDDGGATWTPALVVDDVRGRKPHALGSLSGTGQRLVAVGSIGLSSADADTRSVMWTSGDAGITWERVPNENVPRRTYDITAGGPGFVAVGNAGSRWPDSADAAVWVSVDGRDWERLPDDSTFVDAWIYAVTEHGGVLVAAGFCVEGDESIPVIWRSLDGRQWTRQELSSSGSLWDVAAGPNGFVAVGGDGQPHRRAVAWLSRDGSNWSSQVLDDQPDALATRVAANAIGFLAQGLWVPAIDYPPIVWFSSWAGTALRQEIGADLGDVIGTGERFVAVGGCPGMIGCGSEFLVIGRPGSR